MEAPTSAPGALPTTVNSTSSMAGKRWPWRSAIQYSELRSSKVDWPSRNSFRRYGPQPMIRLGFEPTPYAAGNTFAFTAGSRAYWGTIGTLPKTSRTGANTSGVTPRTVKSSTLVTANPWPRMRNSSSVTRLNSGLYMMSFQVKTTSSAVSGSPSLQRTPWRSLNVHAFWSGATDHVSARPGPGSCVTQSTFTREAYSKRMMPSDAPSIEKRGLNVLGLALAAITRRPPSWTGSPLAMSGDAGRGCAGPRFTASDLPQPASASTATSSAT